MRLGEALESLAVQKPRDFGVVIVDMSCGANHEVLASFASRLELRRVTIERCSRPKALNAGIAAATAPVIAILDDDNLYDRNQLEIFLSRSADYVYSGVRHATYTPDGERVSSREVSRPFAFDDLLMGNFIHATGSAFRKTLWERIGGYDERFEVFEDWHLPHPRRASRVARAPRHRRRGIAQVHGRRRRVDVRSRDRARAEVPRRHLLEAPKSVSRTPESRPFSRDVRGALRAQMSRANGTARAFRAWVAARADRQSRVVVGRMTVDLTDPRSRGST